MKLSTTASALAFLLILLQGCSSDTEQSSSEIDPALSSLTGTVYFEAEPRLTAGRSLVITLTDVTDGEENSVTLATAQTGEGATSPHTFTLAYDPRLIQDGRQYRVQAELMGGGMPDKQSLSAIDPFSGQELTLAFARPKPKPIVLPKTISLQGFKWYLDSIEGESLEMMLEQRPYIELDPKEDKFSGFAGCNRFTGTYTLNGTSLDLGQAAVTRMACESGMEIEDRFLAMLGKVGSWRLKDQRVVLGDADREILAEFKLEQQLQ